MGELFDRFDVEPVMGKDITIGNRFPEILISEKDEVFCYLRPNFPVDNDNDEHVLHRVSRGCVVFDRYINSKFRSNHLYKKLYAGVRLPHPDNYFAVFVDGKEEDALTRKIFGLTYKELEELLDAYSKVLGINRDYYNAPKITHSIARENFCDLTEILIPKQFPYITFKDNAVGFSYVSLWGFYRHIQLITSCKTSSVFSKALMECELSEDIINTIFSINEDIVFKTKVTEICIDRNIY